MAGPYPTRILHQVDVESVIDAKIAEAELGDVVVGTAALLNTGTDPGEIPTIDDLGDAALLNVGTVTGTIAAGDDARFTSGVWGPWTDGVSASAANLADVAHAINTTDKTVGKMVWDTTNHIPLFAGGAAAADHWYTVAGVDTVSPV